LFVEIDKREMILNQERKLIRILTQVQTVDEEEGSATDDTNTSGEVSMIGGVCVCVCRGFWGWGGEGSIFLSYVPVCRSRCPVGSKQQLQFRYSFCKLYAATHPFSVLFPSPLNLFQQFTACSHLTKQFHHEIKI
jgi:hypothetical protein